MVSLYRLSAKTCGRNGCTSGRSHLTAMCVNAVRCWAWVAFVDAVAVRATYGFSNTIVPFSRGCQKATDVSSKFMRRKVMPGRRSLHWLFHSCHPIWACAKNAIPGLAGCLFCGATLGAARRPLPECVATVTDPEMGAKNGPKKGPQIWCPRCNFLRNVLPRNCILHCV